MSQHLSKEVIEHYHNGELSPSELLTLDDHLALCDRCQVEMRNNEGSREAYARAISAVQPERTFEDMHLAFQQMADYVDDNASDVDREIVDSHLEFCTSCRSEVKDLEARKTALAELPDTIYSPAKAPGVWERLAAWWELPSIRIPVQVATAMVLVGLIIWAVTLYLRRPVQQAQEHPGEPEHIQTSENKSIVTPPVEEKNNVRLAADLIDGDGHITLTSDDKLSGLESGSIQLQKEVVSALKNGRVKAPSFMADLKGQSGRLMGAGTSEYGLLNPVARVVESSTPIFRWRAIQGAESYVVTIYGLDSSKIAASGPLTETKWKPSAPFARGHIYTWQVRAVMNGAEVLMPPPAAAEARFRIIDGTKAEALAQARRKHARSHLALGIAYADAGLLDESERELRKLVAANPESSIAKTLLRSVQAQKVSK